MGVGFRRGIQGARFRVGAIDFFANQSPCHEQHHRRNPPASSATVDDINPALPEGPLTMGIMVYSLLWVMQNFIINRNDSCQKFPLTLTKFIEHPFCQPL